MILAGGAPEWVWEREPLPMAFGALFCSEATKAEIVAGGWDLDKG